MNVNMTNALILNNDDLALLIHNCKNGNDRWEFPGGKVEGNDSLEETTIRELKEEIGVDIELTGVLGDYETITPEGKFLCRTYFARIIKGEPKIMERKKADDLRYVSYGELLRLKESGTLVPNLIAALPKLREHVN